MAWMLKRMAISAFILFHLVTIGIWNLPACPIRDRCESHLAYYVYPTGQWQNWGMFAPNPPQETTVVEAIVRDRQGLIHPFAFTRLAGQGMLRNALLFRHAKYSSTMSADFARPQREYAARYVIRRLGLRAEDFPVDLQLIYQVSPIPPHGATDDTPVVPFPMGIETYTFPNLEETLP